MPTNVYQIKRRRILSDIGQARRCRLSAIVRRLQVQLADIRLTAQYN